MMERAVFEKSKQLELVRIQIPKSKWDNVPVDERVIFILLGHVANELNVLDAIAAGDPERAITTLMDEMKEVTRLFLSVISGCMWVFISRHLGKDLGALNAQTIGVDAIADGRRFVLPYFVSLKADA